MKQGGLTVAPIIRSGAVLQRDTINHIYGEDLYSDRVTVSFQGKEYTGEVDSEHKYDIELPPVPAGGPYCITIKGSSEIMISDLLFGDVYLLSGQSNMELPIARVLDVSGEEVKRTKEPFIRQYHIPATFNFSTPEEYMYSSEWKKAEGDDLMSFSAAGYFFAKELKEAYNIPIGLIATAVGGSTVEAWMKPETLAGFGEGCRKIEEFKDMSHFTAFIEEQQKNANEWSQKLEAEEEKIKENEDYRTWNTCEVPSLLSEFYPGSFSGSIYLRRELILEEEPEGEAVISMGTIIDSDQLWVNNTLVGGTPYRYPPRKYKIAEGVLRKGLNLITVRIVINNKNGGTIRERPYYLSYNNKILSLEGEWYYRIGKKAKCSMPEVLFPPMLPVCFYHTVVVPLSRIAVKGILWYQGESNTGHPSDYADKFSAMVADWRELSGRSLPFIFTQLPNYREPLNDTEDTGWAAIRDEQRRCLTLDNVAMITTLDIGEATELHPQNKKAVGVRLANAARSLIYKEDTVSCGPLPKHTHLEENKIVIEFENLEEAEGENHLNNFEAAGEDGVYYVADAVRKGKLVQVTCNAIANPVHVRYAWRDNPINLNFFNDKGLPASCFCIRIS